MIDKFGREAVLASLSPRRVKEAGLLTSGTFGPTGTISSASANLQSCLESRLRPLLNGSGLCEVIWKPWTTPWGAVLSKPRARVRTTFETDTGLWVSPHSSSSSSSSSSTGPGTQGRQGGPNIQTQAFWSTIRASDGEKGGPNQQFGAGFPPLPAQAAGVCQTPVADDAPDRAKGKINSRGEPKLSGQVMASARPTPTTRDHKDNSFCPNVPINGLLGRMVWPTPTSLSGGSETSNPPGNSRNNNNIRKHALAATPVSTWATPASQEPGGTAAAALERKRQANLKGSSMGICVSQLSWQIQPPISNGSSAPTEKRGALNPEFVCWLMGYPTEYLNCAPSETRSTTGRRKRSSKPPAQP